MTGEHRRRVKAQLREIRSVAACCSVYHRMFEQVSHHSMLGTKKSALGVTHRCHANPELDGSLMAGEGRVGGAAQGLL